MKRKVTVQSVIIHFYALYLKKQPSSAELLREANLIIEKCNKHILQEGDKYLSDTIKQVNTVDYDSWMRVFPLAKKSLLSLQANAIFDKSLFQAVLTGEQYLYQSLRVHLSPGRYYDRGRRIFQQIIHYLYYFQLITVP